MSNSKNSDKNFGERPFQMNRYFYGKLMSVRDFEKEQSYMNDKRHMLNRLVSGSGLICGFSLEDIEISVQEGNIKIQFKKGGAAIDCWGQEIVVPASLEARDVLVEDGASKYNLTVSEVGSHQYYLYLKFDPREGELVSSAMEDSSCEETCCPNRIIEKFEVIASREAPPGPAISCPPPFGAVSSDIARQKVKEWLMAQTTALSEVTTESRVFLLAIKQESPTGDKVSPDLQLTEDHLVFVTNNRALSQLLACHLADFANPHQTSAAQVGALSSIDGVRNDGGDVDLIQDNSIVITPDDAANTITISENHSTHKPANPHETRHAQLHEVLEIFGDSDDAARNKHVSNNDAGKWDTAAGGLDSHVQDLDNPHQTTAQQVGALSIEGGMVTGKVFIKTEEWNGLTADATRTYGVMGRITEDLESGSDYRHAGVVGISEIEGKHGLYARAPEGSHALFVEGSALFTGAKSGYVVDIFLNSSGTTLKTGDVVKLKGTKVHRYYGEHHKIPVAEVTLADQANDPAVIGIVDSRAVLDEEKPKKKSKKATDPTVVEDGQELYVVTLGCYARCQVDAGKTPIGVGDLLTSSANPGHARKAADPRIGTIIGKALEPLKKGTGSIAVFVNIQ